MLKRKTRGDSKQERNTKTINNVFHQVIKYHPNVPHATKYLFEHALQSNQSRPNVEWNNVEWNLIVELPRVLRIMLLVSALTILPGNYYTPTVKETFGTLLDYAGQTLANNFQNEFDLGVIITKLTKSFSLFDNPKRRRSEMRAYASSLEIFVNGDGYFEVGKGRQLYEQFMTLDKVNREDNGFFTPLLELFDNPSSKKYIKVLETIKQKPIRVNLSKNSVFKDIDRILVLIDTLPIPVPVYNINNINNTNNNGLPNTYNNTSNNNNTNNTNRPHRPHRPVGPVPQQYAVMRRAVRMNRKNLEQNLATRGYYSNVNNVKWTRNLLTKNGKRKRNGLNSEFQRMTI